MIMNEKITLDRLVKELEAGSNYKKDFDGEGDCYDYDNVKIIFGENSAQILRANGFEGEEGGANTYGHVIFRCSLPKLKMEKALSELVDNGKTKINNVEIDELAYGNLPDNDNKKIVKRVYQTDLEIKLNLSRKPIIDIDYNGRLDPYDSERIYELSK